MKINEDDLLNDESFGNLVKSAHKLAKVPEEWREAAKMRMAGWEDSAIKERLGFKDRAYRRMLETPEFEILCTQQLMVEAWGGAGPALRQMKKDSLEPGATKSQEDILKIVGVLRDKRDIKLEQKSQQMVIHGNLADLSRMHPHEACKEMLTNIKDELGIGKDVLLEYVNEIYMEEENV